MRPCQGRDRGFESRHPRQAHNTLHMTCAGCCIMYRVHILRRIYVYSPTYPYSNHRRNTAHDSIYRDVRERPDHMESQ